MKILRSQVITQLKTVKSLKKLLITRKIPVNRVFVLNVKTVSIKTKLKKVLSSTQQESIRSINVKYVVSKMPPRQLLSNMRKGIFLHKSSKSAITVRKQFQTISINIWQPCGHLQCVWSKLLPNNRLHKETDYTLKRHAFASSSKLPNIENPSTKIKCFCQSKC